MTNPINFHGKPRFAPKAIGCLMLAATNPITADWEILYQSLCHQYSEKAVNAKMEELADRDYIEYGVSARTGWLTEKGAATLSEITGDEIKPYRQ